MALYDEISNNLGYLNEARISLIIESFEDKLFTQEDVWRMALECYGYVHYGSINPVVNAFEKQGIIEKVPNKYKKSMFGVKMGVYRSV